MCVRLREDDTRSRLLMNGDSKMKMFINSSGRRWGEHEKCHAVEHDETDCESQRSRACKYLGL